MKYWKSCLIKTLILNTFCVFSYGQTITVKNITTLDPVPFVNVCKNQNNCKTSNIKGEVDISNYNALDELTISCVGYKTRKITKQEIKEKKEIIFLTSAKKELNNIIVSANKNIKKENEVSYSVESLSVEEIKSENKNQTPEILNSFNGVTIQKSQLGGGSPIIRGLEANRIVLMCDGVRLNNAIYRSGHLQNSLSVDPHIIDFIEVVFGPSSTFYGSDALGGVISFYTKPPQFSKNNKGFKKNNFYSSFSTAEENFSIHFDNNIGGKNIANLFSITYNKFGNTKMGESRNHGYSEWGLINHYIENDQMIENSNPNIQVGTGYDQLDLLNNIIWKCSPKLILRFNNQFSTSSNIPRYDNLQDYNNNVLKWSIWDYGPQTRFLSSLKLNYYKSSFFYDQIKISTSYQFIEEDRITRKYLEQENQNTYVDVHVTGLNIDFLKNKFSYGGEYIFNNVFSTASDDTQPRYPSEKSTMNTFALYGSFEYKINNVFFLNVGSRFSSSQVHMNFDLLDSVFINNFTINKIGSVNNALTGNINLLYSPSDFTKLGLIINTGFRSPNIDDFGKVFVKRNSIVVPNSELIPENAYNAELNINKSFGKFNIKSSLYNTSLKNMITKQNLGYNIFYNGDTLSVQRLENSKKSYIRGFSFYSSYDLNENIIVENSFNIQKGFDVSNNEPLGHIPPYYGNSSIKIFHKKTTSRLWTNFAFKKTLNKSNEASDNIDLATDEGWPGWQIINLSFKYDLNKNTKLQLNVENILDVHYITFASGISSPGRSFKFSVNFNY